MNRKRKEELLLRCLNEISDVSNTLRTGELRREVCRILKEKIPYYDWVGFYLSDGKDELVLHEFEGEPTIHTRIKYGEGICGQAAVNNRTFLVPDVSKENNYLSCSIKVKSEIVVPIIKDGKFYGELDIDSHTVSAFDETDREYLEEICRKICERM